MKIKITEKAIKGLIVKDKAYEVSDSIIPGFIIRVQPTGLKVFWYRYTIPQTSVRSKIKLGRYGEITLMQAKELVTKHAGVIANGGDPQGERRAKRDEVAQQKKLTLKTFIAEYYEPWVVKQLKSAANNIYILNKRFNLFMNQPLNGIKPYDVEKWQYSELDRGLKPASVNRNLACLKAVFSRAVYLKMIEESPIKDLKDLKVVDDDRIRFLSIDEKERLIGSMRKRNAELVMARQRANHWRLERGYELYPSYLPHHFVDHIEPMVLLAMNTGLRKGEIFSLSWQDVDFSNSVLTVRASKSKSKKLRHVSLNNKAKQVLKCWYDQFSPCSGFVFQNKNGKPFKDIKKAWGSVLKSACIDDFRFHDLRHHFASHLVMRGAHLNTVRELLGHSDLTMTLRYAHLAEDHKAEAVMLLDD